MYQPASPASPASRPQGPAGQGWPVRQPGPLSPWLPNPDSQQANTKYSNITEGRLITPLLSVRCPRQSQWALAGMRRPCQNWTLMSRGPQRRLIPTLMSRWWSPPLMPLRLKSSNATEEPPTTPVEPAAEQRPLTTPESRVQAVTTSTSPMVEAHGSEPCRRHLVEGAATEEPEEGVDIDCGTPEERRCGRAPHLPPQGRWACSGESHQVEAGEPWPHLRSSGVPQSMSTPSSGCGSRPRKSLLILRRVPTLVVVSEVVPAIETLRADATPEGHLLLGPFSISLPELSQLKIKSWSQPSNLLQTGFYPRPVLAIGYCRCLRLSVCVSVRVRQPSACPRDNSSSVQARITKFGP